MLYLVAVFFPFVSLFAVGKPIQAIVSLGLYVVSAVLVLTVIASWLGFILFLLLVPHAFFVVHGARADRRAEKIVEAIKSQE